jgi:dipeptidyl aminopeptidase/acylaminoacyl peptidase
LAFHSVSGSATTSRKRDAPLEYFHYDRGAHQVRRLFSSTPAWEGLPFVPMEPIVVSARDGLELVSYLSRPRGPLLRSDANDSLA